MKPMFARSHTFMVGVRARFHTDRALERNVRLRTPMVFAGPLSQLCVMEPRHSRAWNNTTAVLGRKVFATVFRDSVSVFAQLPQLGQRILAARKIVRHGEIHHRMFISHTILSQEGSLSDLFVIRHQRRNELVDRLHLVKQTECFGHLCVSALLELRVGSGRTAPAYHPKETQ